MITLVVEESKLTKNRLRYFIEDVDFSKISSQFFDVSDKHTREAIAIFKDLELNDYMNQLKVVEIICKVFNIPYIITQEL